MLAVVTLISVQGSASDLQGIPDLRGDVAVSVTPAGSGADKTAGTTVLRTALTPAPSTTFGRFAAGCRTGSASCSSGGRQPATRTLGVALESSGEADYDSAPGGMSVPSGISGAQALTAGRVAGADKCRAARKSFRWYVGRTGHWREQMGRNSTWLAKRGVRVEFAQTGAERRRSESRRPTSCPRARFLASRWRGKARGARYQFELWFERTYARWACIHAHEGSWTDPNPPFWGGLQMDLSFQRAYGPEFLRRYGTADRWPVYAQLLAAERAHRTRGFGPWPSTAAMCGLS